MNAIAEHITKLEVEVARLEREYLTALNAGNETSYQERWVETQRGILNALKNIA